MRIVIVSDWFADKMGYAENILPRVLGKLGAEVHLVTSDLQPDFPNYKQAYEPFLGPRVQPVGITDKPYFKLHRLPHSWHRHGIWISGLGKRLREIKPDVVQCFTIATWCTYQTVASKYSLGFKLFMEEHTHRSVCPTPESLRGKVQLAIYRQITGRIVNHAMEKCYPIAPDVLEVSVERGLSASKCEIVSLGVDTDVFTPAVTDQQKADRKALRNKLGFADEDIVCIYTGRFSPDKNPLCLAKAIDQVHATDPRIKGLFIGSGSPEEIAQIQACAGCVTHPFVEFPLLPDYYRSVDIGVWPKQESTSQLDAAACGLPLVLSNRISVTERVEGNGLLYIENDSQDMARQLQTLMDPQVREKMSEHGIQKIREQFSWDHIAKARLADYQASLT